MRRVKSVSITPAPLRQFTCSQSRSCPLSRGQKRRPRPSESIFPIRQQPPHPAEALIATHRQGSRRTEREWQHKHGARLCGRERRRPEGRSCGSELQIRSVTDQNADHAFGFHRQHRVQCVRLWRHGFGNRHHLRVDRGQAAAKRGSGAPRPRWPRARRGRPRQWKAQRDSWPPERASRPRFGSQSGRVSSLPSRAEWIPSRQPGWAALKERGIFAAFL